MLIVVKIFFILKIYILICYYTRLSCSCISKGIQKACKVTVFFLLIQLFTHILRYFLNSMP